MSCDLSSTRSKTGLQYCGAIDILALQGGEDVNQLAVFHRGWQAATDADAEDD